MKRTWKHFRIDKNKIYMRIGQAVVYGIINVLLGIGGYMMFISGMTY